MPENSVQLERVFEKPLNLFFIKLTVLRVILLAFLLMFFLISLYTEKDNIFILLFAILPILSIFIVVFLRKSKVIYLGNYTLECSEAGDIFITQLHGHCSKCDGHLKIKKNKKAAFIQCDKDEKHIWNLFEIKKEEKDKKSKRAKKSS